jgi:hypothetical protein
MRTARGPAASMFRRVAAVAGFATAAIFAVWYWLYAQPKRELSEKVGLLNNNGSALNNERDGVPMDDNKSGVVLTVTVPSEVSAGSTLQFRALLENHTNSRIAVHLGHSLMSLKVEIVGSDGSIARLSERGVKEFPSGLFISTSGPNTWIEPAHSHAWSAALDELFELQPGEYRIVASVMVTTVDRAADADVEVKSRAMKFTIK